MAQLCTIVAKEYHWCGRAGKTASPPIKELSSSVRRFLSPHLGSSTLERGPLLTEWVERNGL